MARDGGDVTGARLGHGPGVIPANRPEIGEEEIAAAVRVLRSGHVVQGPEVAAFESEFSALVAGRHCVAVNSGTSALQLALQALGIGAGDEVIVPSFSFAAVANAVRHLRATPVFADIEPGSFCLDPDAVAAAITPLTAAVMPVHQFGHPAAMDRICAIAEKHGIAVVENVAQAPGATWQGQYVGTFGVAAAFSFRSGKNMHSLEGGMVVTSDPELAASLRLLRNEGNVRLTDVAAAVGRAQLIKLPNFTARRRANASWFDARLTGVVTPPVAAGAGHVYHRYTVRVPGNGRPDRDAFARALAGLGVGSAAPYPTPVHRLPAYRRSLYLPETELAAAQTLALPVHPSLGRVEVNSIVAACNALGRTALRRQ